MLGNYIIALILMLGCTAAFYFMKETEPTLKQDRLIMLYILGFIDLGILALVILTALGI